MSEFTYHIYYRPGFEIGKPNELSRRLREEKSGMYAYFLDAGQLLDFENDDVGEEESAEGVGLQGINVARWEKKNGLCVVPQEHGLEVL